jgi:hypothetical protein
MRLAALPIGLTLALAGALALASEPPGSIAPSVATATPPDPPPPEPAVDPQFDVSGISEYNLPPAPVQGCEAELTAAGAIFKASPLAQHWNRSKEFLCGAKQVIRYNKGPAKIRYSSSPRVTCSVARALVRLEAVIQEEARRIFNKPVVAMQQMGTYNCREIAAYAGWVSQHSFANAIDIKTFTLKGGKTISVQKSYGRGPDVPKSKEGQFLRAVVRRVVDEGVFTVVLTPNFNRAHHNHFHFDLAAYTVDGT